MSRPWPVLGIRTALVLSHLVVLGLPVVAFLASHALDLDLVRQREEELVKQAALVAMLVEARPPDVPLREALTAEALGRVHAASHAGVRIVDTDGVVVGSNGPRLGASMAGEGVVAQALGGEPAVTHRGAVPPASGEPPEARTWAMAAVPLRGGGAVVLTRPSRRPREALQDLGANIGREAVVATGLALALALWSGQRLSRSLRGLAAVADGMAEGRVHVPVPASLTQTRVAQVRAVARAFEAMRLRLAARLRHNEEFASNVSHEFRTPLSTLRATVDVLADDADMPPPQRQRFRDNAHTDLDRLARMVDGLLALARAEGPGVRVEVDLDALLSRVAARHAGVTVTGRAGGILGDPAQVELIVENLLRNAEEHGGPPIRVEAEPGGFSVVDGGPGITAANLPRVFERFFTHSRERRGTGLGLALVRTIAEAHGGGASATSTPGETRFSVWLCTRPGRPSAALLVAAGASPGGD